MYNNKKILFFLSIIYIFSIYKKKKYNVEINKKQSFISDNKKIPKIIHCTFKNKEDIPQKVWDNLEKYAKNYQIIFYNDSDCYHFIKNNYNQQYADKFNSLKLGCHKADFFRYCVMYSLGGIYLDIKMFPRINFEDIFNHEEYNLFYTCLGHHNPKEENIFEKNIRRFRGKGNGHIFQAILATYPNNEIFKYLIKDFFIINNPHTNYHIFTYRFYDMLYDNIGYHLLKDGTYQYKDQKLILFKEHNKKINNDDIKDRHGGYYYVFYNNIPIFRSRYPEFPWKN